MEGFENLIKEFRKKGLHVVLSFDFNGISIEHEWANPNYLRETDVPRFVSWMIDIVS